MIRKNGTYVLLLWVFMLIGSPLVAQTSGKNPIEQAKEEQQKGNIHSAYTIMSKYITMKKNKVQPEVFWYKAQLAYLDHMFKLSENYYDLAYEAMPDNMKLIEDYGAMLLTTGNYEKAIAVLSPNLSTAKAKLYLAKTYYWKGDYHKANQVIKLFTKKELSYKGIPSFLREYKLAKATRLNMGVSYHSDDQPLQTTAKNISLSKKINNLFELSAEGNWNKHQFDTNRSKTSMIRFGTQMTFPKIRSGLRIEVGSFSVGSNSQFLYRLQWHTRVMDHVTVDLELKQGPYLYTTFSTQTITSYTEKTVALNIDQLYKFSGKVQFNNQLFKKNNINSFNGWALYPVFRKKWIVPSVGYAFQVSNSDSSNYVAKYPEGPVGKNVEGVYNSYFTPRNQQVHMALAQLQLNPSKNISFTFISSIPLYASIANPYINNLLTGTGDTIVDDGFIATRYHPFEFKASASIKISDAIRLTSFYQYSKLFFYTKNLFNLSTQILIK